MSPPTFEHFLLLPAELRSMIWDAAAREQCAFFVDFGYDGSDPMLTLCTTPAPDSHGAVREHPLSSNAPSIDFADPEYRRLHLIRGWDDRPWSPRTLPHPVIRHPRFGLLLACKESLAAVRRAERGVTARPGWGDPIPNNVEGLELNVSRYYDYHWRAPGASRGDCKPLKPFRLDLASDLIIFDASFNRQFACHDDHRVNHNIMIGSFNGNTDPSPLRWIRRLAIPWDAFFDEEIRAPLQNPDVHAEYDLSDGLGEIYRYASRSLETLYVVVDGIPADKAGKARFIASGREYFEVSYEDAADVGWRVVHDWMWQIRPLISDALEPIYPFGLDQLTHADMPAGISTSIKAGNDIELKILSWRKS